MSDHNWNFVQSFGDDNSSDDDLVTAVEFDEDGEYLAVGDKAGRICVFEAHTPAHSKRRADSKNPEYKFYTEFQSHEPEFDCLKSLEIEEKINMIKWAKRSNGLFLLAANDKTIKLWKIYDKKIKRPTRHRYKENTKSNFVRIPRLSHHQTITTAVSKRVFSNAHGYHINSISINCDGQTFLSSDDLRINLWNLENNMESFTIVDIKPDNLEELTEVITSATFHPSQCNVMIYASSRGSIRLADMRESALCDNHSKMFGMAEESVNKSFFSEITSSVSDVKFTNEGRYILSRDYLTLKLWDVNMENRPVSIIPIHDYLNMHLCDLYENDCIFDKFECSINNAGNAFVTGSYNNNFVVHNTLTNTSVRIEALKNSRRRGRQNKAKNARPNNSQRGQQDVPNVNLMDFGKKTLHVAWHPHRNTVAIAGLNKLYIYDA